jgi:hypothetical protein
MGKDRKNGVMISLGYKINCRQVYRFVPKTKSLRENRQHKQQERERERKAEGDETRPSRAGR